MRHVSSRSGLPPKHQAHVVPRKQPPEPIFGAKHGWKEWHFLSQTSKNHSKWKHLRCFFYDHSAYFESLPGWFVFYLANVWLISEANGWTGRRLLAFRQVGFEICNSLDKNHPGHPGVAGFLEAWKSTLLWNPNIPKTHKKNTKQVNYLVMISWMCYSLWCVIFTSELPISMIYVCVYDVESSYLSLYFSGTCCWIVHTGSVQEYITTLE